MPEKVTVKAVNTLFVGGDDNTKLDITVLDNYEEKMDKVDSNFTLAVENSTNDRVLTVENGAGVKGNTLGNVKVTANTVPTGKVDTDATVLVKVNYKNESDVSEYLDDVKVTIPVSRMANSFEAGPANEADSDKEFKSGETANVKVTAKYDASDVKDKLGKFTGNVAVKEEVIGAANAVLSTTNKTLSFKDGVAETSFTVKAGTTKVKYTIAGDNKKIATGTYTPSLDVKSKASAEAATKYAVAVTTGAISVVAQNDAGDTYTDYSGEKSLKVTVKDATTGVDVTNDVVTDATLANGTVRVVFTNGVAKITVDASKYASKPVEIVVTDVDGNNFTGSTKVAALK